MGLSHYLARLIRSISSNDKTEVATATTKLDQMKKRQGSFPAMLSLVTSTSKQMAVRQGAVDHLEKWLICINSSETKLSLGTKDMETLKRSIVHAVVDTYSIPHLKTKLLSCFEMIALIEFRHQWISIYTSISSLLQSSHDTKVATGLQLFLGLIKAHVKFEPFENTTFGQQLFVILKLMREIVLKRPTPTPLLTPGELQIMCLVLQVFLVCLKHVNVYFLGNDADGWIRFAYVVPIIEGILRESEAHKGTSRAIPEWIELNELGLACVELVMCRHTDIDESLQGKKFYEYFRDKLGNIVQLTIQLLLKQYFTFTHSQTNDKPLLKALFVLLHSSKSSLTQQHVGPYKTKLFTNVILPLLNFGPSSQQLLDRHPSKFIQSWFTCRGDTIIPTCATHILDVLQSYNEQQMNTLCGLRAVSILSQNDVTPQQKFGALYATGIVANSNRSCSQNFIIPPATFLPLMNSPVEPDYVRLVACWVAGFVTKFNCDESVYSTAIENLTQLLAHENKQPDYIKGMVGLSLERLCDNEMNHFHVKMEKVVSKAITDMIAFASETNDAYKLLKNFNRFCEKYVKKLSVHIIVSIGQFLVNLFMKSLQLSPSESLKILEKLVKFVCIVEKAEHPGLLSTFDDCEFIIAHVVKNKMTCCYNLVCQLVTAFGSSMKGLHVQKMFPLLKLLMEQNCTSAVTVVQNLMFINPTFVTTVGDDTQENLQKIVTKHMDNITSRSECPIIVKIALEGLYTNSRMATSAAQIKIVKFALEILEIFLGKDRIVDCLCAKIIFAPMISTADWEIPPELTEQMNNFISNTIYRLQPGRLFDDGITLIVGLCYVIKYRIRRVSTVPICYAQSDHIKRLMQAIIHILEKLKEKDLAKVAAMEGLPIQALPVFVSTMQELRSLDTPSFIRILNRLTVDEQTELRYVDVEEITRNLPYRVFF